VSAETVNALLLIADIDGYTRFMSMHRTSLAHAQENTLSLLDAVIDAAPDLELSGLEGDAAFLYAADPSAQEIARSLTGVATAMHRAFHAEQARLEALRVCPCDACVQTGNLSVKVVAHYGEAVLSVSRAGTTLATAC
jgi:D-serine deaminase-like pyridoxal phosphate-dependent protein